MKKRIKLRNVSSEEFEKWVIKNCGNTPCKECMFKYVICTGPNSWAKNKELFSDKFLNQEIEIEIPDILDKEEKEYLSAVIKPFRKKFVNIKKEVRTFGVTKADERLYYYLTIRIESKTHVLSDEYINLPYFKEDMYKGMEVDKCYTLEELGL